MKGNNSQNSYNEFWNFFCNEARGRGYNQTEFMALCGLPKTRYNSFTSGKLNLSAYYCYKIMEGLRVTEEYVEKKSGKQFTDAQRGDLRRVAWMESNPDIINALMSSKKLTQDVRETINKRK